MSILDGSGNTDAVEEESWRCFQAGVWLISINMNMKKEGK